jgi:DNA modification methylase
LWVIEGIAMHFGRGSVEKARSLTEHWLTSNLPEARAMLSLGLPEFDDRLDVWRVSIHLDSRRDLLIGELRVDTGLKKVVQSTDPTLMRKRVDKLRSRLSAEPQKNNGLFRPASVPNKVILGSCIDVLEEFPPDTAQLVFTSPPYYNAKPEYSEYVDYQEYLDFLRRAIVRVHAILSEGRFLVINVSPVLVRRTSRTTSSKRIPIPFDLHRILDSVGFDFVDDIIWLKPEGAGWNLGRGRRFRADRKPLQYKPVPVTEYILVYRKRTTKLIDWNLRKHHDLSLVEESKITGQYDVTNVWKIHPAHSTVHPAVFPDELAEKVIRYYSFKNDMVLDPFAGIGTVGRVAYKLDRRFLLIDNEPKYYRYMVDSLTGLVLPNTRVDFDVHEQFRKELDDHRL